MYRWKNIKKRFYKYTWIAIISYVIYVVGMCIWNKKIYDIKELLFIFFAGRYGRGAYYYLMLIQLMLLFPLLFSVVKKYGKFGCGVILLVNLLYEIVVSIFSINDMFYRVFIFRYLTFIVLGIYMFFEKREAWRRINRYISYYIYRFFEVSK